MFNIIKNYIILAICSPKTGLIITSTQDISSPTTYSNYDITCNVADSYCFNVLSGGSIDFTDTIITGNQGQTCIYAPTGSTVVLTRVVMSNCGTYGTGDGGAISSGGVLKVIGSKFTNNFANRGGAIYTNAGADLYVNSSLFYLNEANKGGAIRSWYPNNVAAITYSKFNKNKSKYGAAIATQSNNKLPISDSDFVGNEATIKGIIYVLVQPATVENCVFSENVVPSGRVDIECYGNGVLTYSGLTGITAAQIKDQSRCTVST